MVDFKKLLYNYMESIVNFEGTSFSTNPCLELDIEDQIMLSKMEVAIYAGLDYNEYIKIENMDLITLEDVIKDIQNG